MIYSKGKCLIPEGKPLQYGYDYDACLRADLRSHGCVYACDLGDCKDARVSKDVDARTSMITYMFFVLYMISAASLS